MQSAGPRDLKFFLDLAQQKTAESRRSLFENVADLFISEGGQLSERERAQITAILNDLLQDVETQVRATLSERLKERSDVPAELVVMLANDDIDIARPILTRSPVLRDPDLIEIIRLRDQEYWLAITLRRSLSERVTDAIVATQDVDVIQSLLQNPDARLSQSAMAYLVAEAERIDLLQNPLVKRHDLPPELALRLYWWVSAALRQHIVRNFTLDAMTRIAVDELIEQTARDMAQTDAGLPSLAGTARDLVERLSESRDLGPELLIQLLRNGRIAAVVAAIAHDCAVDERLVRRMLLSGDRESLAILCRQMGFGRNDFATFVLLLTATGQAGRSAPPAELLGMLQFYDDLTPDIAAAVLRYWRRSPDYLRALDQVEAVHRPPTD